MSITLKQISAAILCLAMAVFSTPIILQIICKPAPPEIISIGSAIAKAALPIWVVGLCLYAKSIGYSFLWGMLGLSVIGSFILLLLPESRRSHRLPS